MVKVCITKPAVTLQSSLKAGTVGRFGKEHVCGWPIQSDEIRYKWADKNIRKIW